MSSQPPSGSPNADSVQARLRELAQQLRQADHLDPAAQRELADLMEELGRSVPAAASSAETAHLAHSVAHLAQALRQPHDEGLLSHAKERLEQAIIRAEVDAPLATGIARRLIETLANLGI